MLILKLERIIFVIHRYSPIFAVPKKVTMPKMKTNSGAKKRFKVTGSGKIKRGKAFHRHLLGRKATGRKKELSKSGVVHPSDEARIKLLLN